MGGGGVLRFEVPRVAMDVHSTVGIGGERGEIVSRMTLAVAAVGIALSAGCGAEQSAPQQDLAVTSAPVDRTGRIHVGPSPRPPSTLEPAPVTGVPSADGVAPTVAVDDVRIESDPVSGIDRVVYSFTGSGVPFWRVGYVAEAVPHGGGAPLSVAGRAIVQVDIMGTAPALHSATPLPGPEGSRVAQLHLLSDRREAGGTTQSFIGVRAGTVPFEVVTVDDPPRIVVEFR